MKARELRSKAITELKTFLNESRRKLFKMRLVKASGDLPKTHEIKQTRRDIARCETILSEKKGKSDE
jgi:large subunit ribosomal protein L29